MSGDEAGLPVEVVVDPVGGSSSIEEVLAKLIVLVFPFSFKLVSGKKGDVVGNGNGA